MENALIVLNYNRTNLIEEIIKTVEAFKNMPHLFIVDNNSNEENRNKIKELDSINKNEKIHFIYNDINLGYAKGNNEALKVIDNYLDCQNVFMMNPDIILKDGILDYISNFINETKDAGVVTIAHVDGNLKFSQRQGWPLMTFKDEIKTSFLIGRKKYYKKLPIKFDNDINKIDVIDGSFFGINYQLFKSIGFFDPNTFLYYEENILGYKIKQKGLQSYILNYEINPIHNHEESITSTIKFRRNWKYYNNSRKYYCKNYLKLGLFKRFILNCAIGISTIESFFISLFK